MSTRHVATHTGANQCAEESRARPRIALAGNPNSGKTSMFNLMTGARQHVGNWGGVTVDIKEGTAACGDQKMSLIDLPGTYSLSAYSLEEKVARDFIVEERPDVVINVIDAANLERNLYLTVQLLELGVRPILAFNMWDEVRARGLRIDIELLSRLLGLTIIPTVGKRGEGLDTLLQAALTQARAPAAVYDRPLAHAPPELSEAVANLAAEPALGAFSRYSPQWIAVKLFEYDRQIEQRVAALEDGARILAARDAAAESVEQLLGHDPESLIAECRYGFIAGALKESMQVSSFDKARLSDRIDKVMTHPFWAYPVFILFMWLLFQATFVLGEYPMQWIEAGFGALGDLARLALPPGNARDLIVDGVIGGVGGVAVFLPNIMILFLGIAIMEDSGYMARAAFIMDKVMHKIGLHGKSFIPILIGMGCNVPAILATRTLENENDRIKTILLSPLISCSARLPVYVLFAGALFPRNAGNIVFLFQFVFGTAAFFLVGLVFKKTLFRGEDYPFVMELPPYRLPTVRSVLVHMWHRAEHYLKKMGGVVLAFSIILWFLGAFPKNPELHQRYQARIETVRSAPGLSPERRAATIDSLQTMLRSEAVRYSAIGRIGRFFEPLVRPLGFDWRASVSLATGFVAKEIVVSSMGVLYAVSGEPDAHSRSLQTRIARHFTPLTAIAFMVFVLLYTPCIVALVTVIRELRSWKWSLFSVAYQLALAWGAAFAVYQVGRLVL